jgi:hypothetical protein
MSARLAGDLRLGRRARLRGRDHDVRQARSCLVPFAERDLRAREGDRRARIVRREREDSLA